MQEGGWRVCFHLSWLLGQGTQNRNTPAGSARPIVQQIHKLPKRPFFKLFDKKAIAKLWEGGLLINHFRSNAGKVNWSCEQPADNSSNVVIFLGL